MPIGRRLAAGGALLTLPAMVAVAVPALFGDPSRLVLALFLLALAAGAAWMAATLRGLVRWLSVIAAAACVVGIAFVLTLGTGGIITLVAIGLLLGAFGACARYALGEPPRPGSRVPAARRGVLIVNPKSGGGKAERFRLFDEAAKRGIETIELTPGSDLRALAEQAVADGADVLGMAGGDGSQALVASVAAAHGLGHVCIPSRTRNHFALDLGLDRDDVVGALEAYGPALERTIDLTEVNGRVFVNNASLGAYAEVVQSDEYRDAKLQRAVRRGRRAGLQQPVSPGVTQRRGHTRANRPGDARSGDRPHRGRRRRREAHGARGHRPPGSISRLPAVGARGARGRSRPRRARRRGRGSPAPRAPFAVPQRAGGGQRAPSPRRSGELPGRACGGAVR
jgi:hypothetical protein